MRNIWLVIKHDFGITIRQRSFWIMTLLVPLLMLGSQLYFVISDNGFGSSNTDSDNAEQDLIAPGDSEPSPLSGSDEDMTSVETAVPPKIGLVDPGGLIAEMPPNLETDLFITYPSELAAHAALEEDKIFQFAVIPSDYVETGDIIVFDKEFQIFQDDAQSGVAFGNNGWMLEYMLNYNLTKDEQLLGALQNPVPGMLAEYHRIQVIDAGAEEGDTAVNAQESAAIIAAVMPYIFYFLLLMGSSYLMRVVILEKENRTVELLLLSVNPQGLMVGKIVAMSIVMLIQIIIWLGGGILFLNNSAEYFNLAQYDFPPGFMAWAIAFLVLGYLLFAAIMAAAGALSNSVREAGQVTWLLVIPLMPTLMFGDLFLQDPDGSVSMILSFFPFSAPSAMVTRIAVANVPIWQRLLSLGGLAVTTYIVVTLAARFFRPHHLLSSSTFNWRRLATGWRK